MWRRAWIRAERRRSTHRPNVFIALADPTRRAIVRRLERGECSVSELAQPFDVSLPAVTKHLRMLERAGLLEHHKVGRVRWCRLVPEAMREADEWIARYRCSGTAGSARWLRTRSREESE